MRIITRKEWGARKARPGIVSTTWDRRTGFMVHYSAASASQSPRSIQAYHMINRGWSDIGYNYLIGSRDGKIYEGRGWSQVGAHCAGHNTATIGVCVIGRDDPDRQDVSDAARESLRQLHAVAQRLKGRPLPVLGHRDRGRTECPGDELYAYINGDMLLPRPTGPDWRQVIMQSLPTLREGNRGRQVRQSMGLLAAAGRPPRNSMRGDGTYDGIAGDGWGDAIEAFQRSGRLTVDRICGPQTWTALLA